MFRRLRVFQYWHDADPPDDVREVMESWHVRGLRHQLFDETAARRLIDSVSPSAGAAFRACAVPAMQSDLFRYAALWLHGGVYADVSLRNHDVLALPGGPRGALFLRGTPEEPPVRIVNGLMLVRKRHDPLLRWALDQATANVRARSSRNTWEVTGPGVLTRLLEADEAGLLDGFSLVPYDDARPHVEPVWLPYKRGETDWRRYLDREDISPWREP